MVSAKIAPFSTEFLDPLEPFEKKNYLDDFDRALSQLSKTVQDFQIGQTLAKRLIKMGRPIGLI